MDVFGGNYDQYGRRITAPDVGRDEMNRIMAERQAADQDPARRGIYAVAKALGADPGASDLIATGLNFVPVVGEGMDVSDAITEARQGNWLGAGISALAATAPFIPGVVAKGLIKGGKKGKKVAKAVAEGASKAKAAKKAEKIIAKNMASLPDLRSMGIRKALRVARKEPHLIPKKGGGYVGAPADIKTRKDLLRQRRLSDKTVERGIEGADWYDRYREYVRRVTGGDENLGTWMSRNQAQYSAGVSPENELGYSVKDVNSSIAYGRPTKVARPAQQEASIRAIETNDPMAYQLGDKTGEYGFKNDPLRIHEPKPATGVNDFRHAQNLGYKNASGASWERAMSPAEHRYMDYETALMVDRANRKALGGRTDWTGERVQAAPWVAQKADSLYERQYGSYRARAIDTLQSRPGYNGGPLLDEDIDALAWEFAFDDANKTIADFGVKHEMYATHEAQPFDHPLRQAKSGSMTPEQRKAFAQDPRSGWMDETGRDAAYAGMRLGDTGVAMRVDETKPMRGVYTNKVTGETEFNPGSVARPLVAFDLAKSGEKSLPDADRAIVRGVEAVRAVIDMQGAGAAHKTWLRGPVGSSTSFRLRNAKPGVMPKDTMLKLQEIGKRYGIPDIVDTHSGATMTRFYPGPPETPLAARDMKRLSDEIGRAAPGRFDKFERAKVDSVYEGFEDAWMEGVGSGAVTRQILGVLDELPPGVTKAIDANPAFPARALQRIQRDKSWKSIAGVQAEDIQNLRQIIGDGPGWIGRLRAALESGVILPALAGVVLYGTWDQLQAEDGM